jgi:hypothetical protein
MQSAAEGEPSEESRVAENVNTVSDPSTVIQIRNYLRHRNLGQHVSPTRRRQSWLAEFQIKDIHRSTRREIGKCSTVSTFEGCVHLMVVDYMPFK